MDLISLYQVDFDIQENWTIDFNTPNQRDAYLASRLLATIEEISVINDFSQVNISGDYLSYTNCNYCRFTVTLPYSSAPNAVTRTYYAYVTNIRWGGVGLTIADIQIDYIQTYLFQYNVHGFVSRAHVRETDGFLLTPENGITVRDTGNNNKVATIDATLQHSTTNIHSYKLYFVFITAAKPLFNLNIKTFAGAYGGAHYVYCVPYYSPLDLHLSQSKIYINNVLVKTFDQLVDEGLLTNPDVLGLYISPVIPGAKITDIEPDDNKNYYLNIPSLLVPVGASVAIPLWDNSEETADYTVKTLMITEDSPQGLIYAKLYTSPFYRIFLDLLDSEPVEVIIGDALALAPIFGGDTDVNKIRYQLYIDIKCWMAITDTLKSAYYAAPKGATYNQAFNGAAVDNMVVSNAAEELPLLSDAYIEYQKIRRASSIAGAASGVISSIGGIAGSVITGNPLGVASGLLGAAKTASDFILNEKQLQQEPRKVRKGGNNFAFDMLTNNINCRVIFKKYEYTNAFDVFNHFGYTINKNVSIDTKCRQYFNYIQYSDAVIGGNIPTIAKTEIKARYEQGITFWHLQADGTVAVGDYSKPNREIAP